MSRATQKTKKDNGPEVFRFKARLARRSKTDSKIVLNIPKSVGQKLGDMKRIEGIINNHPFRAVLESSASGDKLLHVNKAMSKGAGAEAGDVVILAILGPEPELITPGDLQVALVASLKAKKMWQSLDETVRRDWVRWIELAKKPETRTHRVARTVEQLSEGKRRPCCVNVYEYMLRRIEEEK